VTRLGAAAGNGTTPDAGPPRNISDASTSLITPPVQATVLAEPA
jgi:hypothetical protein